MPAAGATGVPSAAATSERSPVNLSTPVDMANGVARRAAVVRAGDARFEVLSPTLLRLEYAPSGTFENGPTVNVIDRSTSVPVFRSRVSGGWLRIRTTAALLRYKLGSGPFTPANTSLQFEFDGRRATVQPTWDWECPFGQVCQSGAATLSGGASLGQTFSGYESTAGYVGDFLNAGAGATWQVLGAPGGDAHVSVRYSNVPTPPLAPLTSALELKVNGVSEASLLATPTSTGAPWSTLSATVPLRPGTNAVELVGTTKKSFNLGIDSVSIAPVGEPAPQARDGGALGGWFRGFDTQTYNVAPTCGPGQQGATCEANIESLNTDGLLDRAGWRLLDDTKSALWTSKGWIEPRPPDSDIEDGYLFVYGHNYAGALETFTQLTGHPPLPDRNVFGVWYSDYTPYSSNDIEDSVYPAFRSNDVPLDVLSLDTDWKAPNNWNGWEWDRSLFPDPSSFLSWARARGVDVTLNVHSSIDNNDPRLAGAQRVAGGGLASSSCSAGPCKVWDWSSVSQAESNFSLQQSFEGQGVNFWWLDWCCDDSVVSMPGVTPDSWIDHLYAQELTNKAQRGFVLARIGGSNADPEEVYAAGPWSDHTSTIAFTGDAWGTWNTLAAEAALVPDEATIGEPFVSSDVGSFLGPPPTQAGADPPDLYDRWVQLGTFQPILRLHSNNEDRLPWQYPQPVRAITESFLRLRESLVPYTYTLAAQAHASGLPMDRPLYLDYPNMSAAYANPTEFLYGPDMLVAPVTAPGDVAATNVWFPPGRWVDYFTGATFLGPTTATLQVPLDEMPVFVRSGGIVTEQAARQGAAATAPRSITIKSYAGAPGSFSLYEDAGTGLGYRTGKSTETQITTEWSTAPSRTEAGAHPSMTVHVGATIGTYPGRPRSVDYTIDLVDLSSPSRVTVDGTPLSRRTAGTTGWTYDPAAASVVVRLGSVRASAAITLRETGGSLVSHGEPLPG